MVIVDGDSMAFWRHDNWPRVLGEHWGCDVKSLATHKTTATQCASRMWIGLAEKPWMYFLHVGQWSQNHESLFEFDLSLRTIIERVQLAGTRVCLVTGAADLGMMQRYIDAMRRLARIYRTGLIDLFSRMREDGIKKEWIKEDSSVRCHLSEEGSWNMMRYVDEANLR